MERHLFYINRRNDIGLSQAKVGDLLGYSSQSISAWESNRSQPDLSIWSKYASILEVDLESFINCKVNNDNSHCEELSFDIDKFSKNLHRLRKRKHLTQLDIASKVGVNVKTIASWEKGLSFPNFNNFISLCEFYKLSYDELYFVIDKPVKKNKHVLSRILIPVLTGLTTIGVTIGVISALNNKKSEEDDNPPPLPVEYIGADSMVVFDYIIDDNEDHIYDISNPEDIKIVLQNLDNHPVTKVAFYIDSNHYELGNDEFVQDRDIITINKDFFTSIYTSSGYNSYLKIDYIITTFDDVESYTIPKESNFLLGIVDSSKAIEVNSINDFISNLDEYRYYILNKDITLTSDDINLSVKGVINGNGHKIGNVAITKVGTTTGEYKVGIFSYFSGVIHNLVIDNMSYQVRIATDNKVYVSTLIAEGVDYSLSKISFTNITINGEGISSPIYASMCVAKSSNGIAERISINNCNITLDGDGTLGEIGPIMTDSPTYQNYSIRDSIISNCTFINNCTAEYSTIAGAGIDNINSGKRIIVYNNIMHLACTHRPCFGGIIYQMAKEVESCLVIKNDVVANDFNFNKMIVNWADVSSKYNFTYENTVTFDVTSDEVKNGTQLESVELLKESSFYNHYGYRSLNWVLSDLLLEEQYKMPYIR